MTKLEMLMELKEKYNLEFVNATFEQIAKRWTKDRVITFHKNYIRWHNEYRKDQLTSPCKSKKKKGVFTMLEFEIYNVTTNEHNFIYGYNRMDAWRRCTWLNREDWEIIAVDYID